MIHLLIGKSLRSPNSSVVHCSFVSVPALALSPSAVPVPTHGNPPGPAPVPAPALAPAPAPWKTARANSRNQRRPMVPLNDAQHHQVVPSTLRQRREPWGRHVRWYILQYRYYLWKPGMATGHHGNKEGCSEEQHLAEKRGPKRSIQTPQLHPRPRKPAQWSRTKRARPGPTCGASPPREAGVAASNSASAAPNTTALRHVRNS